MSHNILSSKSDQSVRFSEGLKPLIKWPGGKTQEFDYIKNLIPQHARYVEPFFGGGAVFFQLKPKRAIVNDLCGELVDFYKFAKGEYDELSFERELFEYVKNWEKIPGYIKIFENQIINLYSSFKKSEISEGDLYSRINEYLRAKEKEFNGLFRMGFCIDRENLLKQIIFNLVSKLIRMRKIEQERGKMKWLDLNKNIETAFRSGFYMHFRDVMNRSRDRYEVSHPKKIANFYFIREFCYGSMFRFNANGDFNIPYGGIAYNSKNFRKKVEEIFDQKVKDVFKNTKIECGDFEIIFKKYKLVKDDFIFLDPPYDTEFSDYQNETFDQRDQKRLAQCVYKTPAKFIMIIKNTPFVLGLYKNKARIKIKKFNKTYLYNVKGRNERVVEHLIIYNF